MASAGQFEAQRPHPTHASEFTRGSPSTIVIAESGHSSAQRPQPKHWSVSMTATGFEDSDC